MINILLVEDNHKVRELLGGLLQAQKNLTVAGKAENGLGALRLLQNGLQADVVVADLNMHDMDGIELTEQLMAGYPNLKVIILTMHAKAAFLKRALAAGANGYLLKNGDMNELYQAIAQVYAGQTVIGASVRQ
ncbi:response regulator transcription factor [Mucilaginibacter sp. CSA2-8R]|uniref:response regulator n=1 Tax=Mucilaginibacter sp. CSA2-8R TaxID=3141542 RepID=UPI00315D7AE2